MVSAFNLVGYALALSGALAFSLSVNSAFAYTENTLYTFCSQPKCADGVKPFNIVLDGEGNIYGTTLGGGSNYKGHRSIGYGIVYEFSPATQTLQVLHTFCQTNCKDGGNPNRVKLVIDRNGNLYGTTSYGGDPVAHRGTVFELKKEKSIWRYEVIYTFCSRKNCEDSGLSEVGLTYAGQSESVVYDGTAPLYGVGRFSIFRLTRDKKGFWKEKTLHRFCQEPECADGAQPEEPLLMDSAGNFFGTTELGGASNEGTVFELSPAGGDSYSFSVLYSFCSQMNCIDGQEPFSSSSLIMNEAGNLMGIAGGDEKKYGVLFNLTPLGNGQWEYSTLFSFGKPNPVPSSLVLSSDDSLIGTTYRGGTQNGGTVFQYSNDTLRTLYTVCQVPGCPEGARPMGEVIQGAQGNIFGTNEAGGLNHGGTLYELVNDTPAHQAR